MCWYRCSSQAVALFPWHFKTTVRGIFVCVMSESLLPWLDHMGNWLCVVTFMCFECLRVTSATTCLLMTTAFIHSFTLTWKLGPVRDEVTVAAEMHFLHACIKTTEFDSTLYCHRCNCLLCLSDLSCFSPQTTSLFLLRLKEADYKSL